MNCRKITSLLIILSMLLSCIPVFSADNSRASLVKDDPGHRKVYLYASEDYNPVPSNESPRITDIARETEFYVYFAIDDPNKGGYIPSGTTLDEKYPNSQYDLNGYNIKISYDTRYFELVKDFTNLPKYIDYTIPFTPDGDSEITGGQTPTTPGYTVWAKGVNEEQGYAYLSVFFNGEFLPEKTDGRDWYNICALPLKTKSKNGTGKIEIDFYGTFKNNMGTEEKSFQLFAKHVDIEDFSPTFTFDAVHGGAHWITIGDTTTPEAPIATPGEGTYVEKVDVVLSTSETNCSIFWTKTPDAPLDSYTQYIPKDTDNDGFDDGGITITSDTEIYCYTQRKDGTRSPVVSYKYLIIPKTPYLHIANNILPTTYYSTEGPFFVTAGNTDNFGVYGDIYYTFDTDISISEILSSDGSADPSTGWKKVIPTAPTLAEQITGKTVVRLVTKLGNKLSYEKWYYLGIVPEPVASSEPSGIKTTPIETELTCATPGNVKIYYTIDNSNPKESGILYTHKLAFNKNTVVNAVAELDGVFSEITTFYYFFDLTNDSGIEAFHPSGPYTGSVEVHLTPHDPENAGNIKYKIDDGPWKDYKGETFHVEQDTTITAKIVDDEGNEGEEATFVYQITPLPPIFAPESTQFTNADKVSVFTPEGEAKKEISELWYTVSGGEIIDPKDETKAVKAGNPDGSNAVSIDVSITGYTVISAVMKKYHTDDPAKFKYSDVVTHTYDIVTQKPTKPMTTLVPGNYVRKIGDEEGYSTQFAPVQNGIKIYYTVSYNGSPVADLDPAKLTPYVEGTDIEVYGNTVITAIAVNAAGISSDPAVFEYTVSPEAPIAPGSTTVSQRLPVIPVTAVKGSDVYYKIGDTTFKVPATDGDFYVDVATGAAYENYTPGGENTPIEGTGGKNFAAPAIIEFESELDKIKSVKNPYVYNVSSDPNYLAPPYADKASGIYEELVVSGCPDKSLLHVKLYSLNNGDTIKYKLNNEANWRTYNGEILKLKADTVIQVQSVKGNYKSDIGYYTYNFIPAPPVMLPISGRYNVNNLPNISMSTHPNAPDYMTYSIIYCANGDPSAPYTGAFPIDHTMSISAYVRNERTGEKSAFTVNYYIIEPEITASGAVEMADPYYGKRRIASHLLNEEPYNGGIVLVPNTNVTDAKIHYRYTYTPVGGTPVTTGTMIYDSNAPIMVSTHMADITVEAWLVDKNGNEINDTRRKFDKIEFVNLEPPTTSLENPEGNIQFPVGTTYEIVDYKEYEGDPKITKYYTTDGTDPVINGFLTNGLLYEDGVTLIPGLAVGTTTVKTVHRSACGTCLYCRYGDYHLCQYPVFGKIGTYQYTAQPSGGGGGGGGGGGSSSVSRKYTKDIFGNEHPTHVGYIKGYPDGSVQPEGFITREEIAAILYRITNHSYEAPFVVTGEVFPDVEAGRWSVKEIEYMTDKNVILGYPDGEFKPRNKLTRAEFAALIFRFTKTKREITESSFIDLERNHWAYEDIVSLCKAGLIQGYEDGSFRPENAITRAEVMTVINKILGRTPVDSYVKSLKFNPFNDLYEEKWYYVIVLEATITHNYWLDNKGMEYKWEDWK